MISFWEKNSFLSYDYIIIGAGLMGMHIAYELHEKEPNAKIIILERGIFPTGASTKNAGFACFGSLSEIVSDIAMNGVDNSLSLIEKRYKGISLLKERLGIENIGYENNGGYELLYNEHLAVLEKREEINELLFPIYKNEVFSIKNEKINEFGFDATKVKSLVFSPYEGQINTGKMVQSYIQLILSKGIQILTGAKVAQLENNKVYIEHNILHEPMQLIATKQVFIASNSFASDLLQTNIAKPGRGQVLITKPIENLKFKGVFHIDEGYYYFRNFENRVLFGGGRNLDFDAEESGEFKNTELIINELKRILRETILPNQTHEIVMQWAGIMGFSENKLPVIKRINEHCIVAMSCNGMGVALSGIMAKEAVQLYNLKID